MRKIEYLLDLCASLIKVVLGLLLGIMLVVALLEVVRRYFLGKSFPWSEELVKYLIIWVSLLGGAVSYKEYGLVYFDMVVDKLTNRKKAIVQFISNTITVGFIIFVLINSIGTVTSPSILQQKSIGLQISMVYPYLAIPIGMTLMLLFGLHHYKDIYELYHKEGIQK